jgi:hypothetical protein
MVDFQGVCLQRALRLEKSAGGLFRGVCTNTIQSNLIFHFCIFKILQTISVMIWNLINHIAMYINSLF